MKTVEELGISRRPWELMDDGVTVVTKIDEGVYGEVAECSDDRYARLIAAAPELYEALRKMQDAFDYIRKTAWFMDAYYEEISIMNDAQNEADVALAKACGEEAK